jgi:DNA primase
MDVIALHAAGIPNAVATLGTAITPEQARLMSRYTKKVIISYDSDEAGQKAATKAMALLEGVGLEVKVLKMQGAKDPDEYIKTFGVDSFRSILTESRTKFDFNIEKVLSKHDISIPQEKIIACAELCLIISQVYSSAEREIYIKELSKKLDIDEKSIKHDVERNVAKLRKASTQKEKQKIHQSAAGYMDKVNPDFVKAPSLARAEEAALGMLLLYPEFRKKAFDDALLLSENDFFTSFSKKVFSFIKDNTDNGFFDDKRIDEVFTPEEVGRITKMKVARLSLQNNGMPVFMEIVNTLRSSVDDKKTEEKVSTLEDISELINKKRALEQMKNPTKSEDNV